MINKKKKYKLGDFNYQLPKTFIAQHPEARRDYSKLMVVHKDTGEIEHKKFYNITDYMRKNDLLIMNNTKVFPARLFATKDRTDAKVEVFLLRELSNDLWEVMVKPARKVRIGNKLVFTPKLMCDVIDNTVSGGRVVRFEYEGDDFDKMIDDITFLKSSDAKSILRQTDHLIIFGTISLKRLLPYLKSNGQSINQFKRVSLVISDSQFLRENSKWNQYLVKNSSIDVLIMPDKIWAIDKRIVYRPYFQHIPLLKLDLNKAEADSLIIAHSPGLKFKDEIPG